MHASHDHRRAILLMLVGLALLLCLDASGKYLGAQGVPVGASTWSRYFGHFLVVLAIFSGRDGVRLFRPRRAWVTTSSSRNAFRKRMAIASCLKTCRSGCRAVASSV